MKIKPTFWRRGLKCNLEKNREKEKETECSYATMFLSYVDLAALGSAARGLGLARHVRLAAPGRRLGRTLDFGFPPSRSFFGRVRSRL